MQITLGEAQVLQHLAAMTYTGTSKPLPRRRAGDRPHERDWWVQSPRRESHGTARHRTAFELYAWLSSHTAPPIEHNMFPAEFVTSDGKRFRPDKGFIKMALARGAIEARSSNGDLVFERII